MVPNEIVIEAMIKGLQPGPTAQYFARKPPQTLDKLLQKMDEYIRADNDFQQRREEAYRYSKMTRGFGGRLHPRHVRTIHNPSSSEDRGNHTQGHQHGSQSSGTQQSFSGHQPQEAEKVDASEEDSACNQEGCFACSVKKIRGIQLGHAKSRYRSKRK
jgi:hypothetical protein